MRSRIKDGDPHSPHLDEGPGVRGVIKGLWHAHMGWLVSPELTDEKRWAPDLLKDKDLVRISKLFPLLAVTSFFLPALLGYALTQSFGGAITAFIWASLVRIFLLQHVTWSINSICHFYGDRPFRTMDFSTNNWVLSLLSFGESWHNNHHAFPTSSDTALVGPSWTLSGRLISIFQKLRWATSVKTVTAKQIAAKKIGAFKPRANLVRVSKERAQELVEDLAKKRADVPGH